MAKNKSVKGELYESLEKDKTVILGLDAKIPYFVNSGHYGLNRVLSGRWLGGWSAGTVGEMFGDPSTGKSLLTSRAMVSLQRKEIYINEGCEKEVDLTDTFIILDDTEKAYQEKFCQMQGMDINDLIKLHKTLTVETHFTQMEDKVDKIRALTKQAPLGVFCDSISQLSTDNEMEKGMETTDMGNKAKKVHQAMRLYSDYIYSNMVMYLANSHVTDSLNPYGQKRVIKGGKGMAFQSTVRLDLRYLSKFIRNIMDTAEVGERGETYGVKILAETVKNRVAPPFMFTVIDVYFDRGIDPYSGLFDYFTRTGQVVLKPVDKKKKEKEKEKEPEETGKKKKKKKKIDPDTLYLFDGKHEFKHAELPQLIISQDLLGVKAAGFEYMTPIDAGEVFEEDLEEDDKDFPTAAPPPPLPPVPPRREPMGE
jgi:RecA/RadA recombinase